MVLDNTHIRKCLKEFDFVTLFIEELGWNRHQGRLDIQIDGQQITLEAIAHKCGLVVYTCNLNKPRLVIDDTIRKIETQVAKSVFEHLIIYIDENKKEQVWQWAKREPGKPIARRHHHFNITQSGESLIQKLQTIAFALDEEETLTIVDASGRLRAAFDIEKVTRRFYDRFKKEHDNFLNFIEGIPDEYLQRWYASVMLNRLMFIYFIQKNGFLDSDVNYLRNKLAQSKAQAKDTFYQNFLCPLFFEGFAKPESERDRKLSGLLGKVPYLNGGIFQKHEIEKKHGQTISIPDKAFEKIFEFFKAYQWHLDDRPLRKDNEINPDVLGYIFEKYINQKQMGAYYTKEDITGYISQNTVIPRIFDMAKEKCKIAFEGEQSIWKLLQNNPDRYIYDAVKHGIIINIHKKPSEKLDNPLPLPDEIAIGLDTTKPNLLERRKNWNKPAPPEYALPTEIWREVVARRKRNEEVKAKLASGEIKSINDLITYNLNIHQFAQDVIENAEGPELLRAFWRAIAGNTYKQCKSNEPYEAGISILDPTCGSGAFLFAALNILEPLYEACLERMQLFVDDLQRSGTKNHPEKFADFKEILEEVDKHPNAKYFIYKSIIVNNLFGVDIMEEAIEICKLRLFLKLIAQIDTVEKIEPLPDIDFNIRAGNTLVGFASLDEVKKAVKSKLDFGNALARITEKAEEVDRLFLCFRQQQISLGGKVIAEDKAVLTDRLKALEDELNGYLAGEYGIKEGTKAAKEQYANWLKSHKPFHWFIDFYGIIKNGGFDVIIGNPPYLELREVDYSPRGFECEESKAIHAMCIERSIRLLYPQGCISMIVPLAIVSTQRMKVVQQLIEEAHDTYYANFAWRPGKLFDTVNRALTIFVAVQNSKNRTFATNYQKWNSDTRSFLIPNMRYSEVPRQRQSFWAPKLSEHQERSLLSKIVGIKTHVSDFMQKSPNLIYYRTTGGLYWKVFTDFAPAFRVNGKAGHSSRETTFSVKKNEYIRPIIAVLSSDIFWWWYTITSNLRDLNPSDITYFPIPNNVLTEEQLLRLGNKYIESLVENSTMLIRHQKQTGKTETQCFKIQISKPIIDEIDKVLAKHYGFTEEELDFIISYDIKYRMGKDNQQDEGEQ